MAKIYRTGKVRFVPEITIDDSALPEDVFFLGYGDIAVDEEGNVYVLDSKAKHNAPKKKFKSDIMDMLYDRDRVWVKTSFEDEEKGSLFDSDGQFLDSFYINIKGRILKIDGAFLYSVERDEDELPLSNDMIFHLPITLKRGLPNLIEFYTFPYGFKDNLF